MTVQNISVVAGNSKTIEATVDVTLTNTILEFRVKRNENVVLRKQDIVIQGNKFIVFLNPADTQNLFGQYDYEIELTDESGNVTTLFQGTLSLEKGKAGVTAEQVFITAMDLMDEETEDGTFNGYPEEYKRKAWNILSLLQAELTPASVIPSAITNEGSTFFLDDRTVLMTLPYGLAAHLLMNEDQNRASFFNSRYDELKRKRPTIISKIKDVYTPQTEGTSITTDVVELEADIIVDGGEV